MVSGARCLGTKWSIVGRPAVIEGALQGFNQSGAPRRITSPSCRRCRSGRSIRFANLYAWHDPLLCTAAWLSVILTVRHVGEYVMRFFIVGAVLMSALSLPATAQTTPPDQFTPPALKLNLRRHITSWRILRPNTWKLSLTGPVRPMSDFLMGNRCVLGFQPSLLPPICSAG